MYFKYLTVSFISVVLINCAETSFLSNYFFVSSNVSILSPVLDLHGVFPTVHL